MSHPVLKLLVVVPALVFLSACPSGPECGVGSAECGGQCVDPQSDDANCGACGNACGTGTSCKAGKCAATCGDGIKAPLEVCDDGSRNAGDGCGESCKIESGWSCVGSPSVCTTGCGDGITAGSEACDDGNAADGDGCSAACAVEHGFACTGAPSTCAATCGDGEKASTEACDDGNTTAADGCSATCNVGEGYTCTGEPSLCATTCGDGVRAGAEGCDDANATSGDGCSGTCQVETGHTCTGAPSQCVTTCGDGIRGGRETCDDGNATASDGCSDTCAIESGYSCTGEPSACATVCGDGITAGAETCDDGGGSAGDGCSATCAIESGYDCAGAPSVCATLCGDGLTAGSETCDDGNAAAADGCSDSCLVETGYTCTGSPSQCATVCGDGVIGGAEACDDGASTPGDGCSATCAIESGYACSGLPSACATVCGDSIIAGGETCDDGDADANDGCDSACAIEAGYTCTGTPSACVAGMSCPAGSTFVAYAATDLPKPVTDNATTTSDVVASAAGTVTQLGVALSIDHTFDGDLDLSLVNGSTSVDLSSDNGSAGDNYVDTVFLDSAATEITAGTVPFTGEHRPEQPLSSAAFGPAAGTWTLSVADDGINDTGSFKSFTLMMCVCTDCEVGPNLCTDTLDNDSDGQTDCADPDCAGQPACVPQTCGNGVVEGLETCDDGNTTARDGCSATCRRELDAEVEPNDTTAAAMVLTPGVAVAAAISPMAEVDYFSFTLTAPADVQIETFDQTGAPSCNGIDPYVTLYDTDGATSLVTDDDDGPGLCSLVTPSRDAAVRQLPAGTYFIKVHELGDNATISYQLKLTLLSVCGNAVTEGYEECDTTATTCTATCTRVPACGDGFVDAPETCDDGNTTAGDGCDATCGLEIAAESGPNGTPAEADASSLQITGSTLISGSITDVSDEKDYFKVTVAAGSVVRFETFGPTPFTCPTSAFTTTLRLFASDGTTQLYTDTTSGLNSCSALVVNLAAGTYYIQVEETGTSASLASYHLQVAFEANAGSELEVNDTQVQANAVVGEDMYVFGSHQVASDADWYAVTLAQRSSIRAEIVEGSTAETCEAAGAMAPQLTLFDAAGTQLATDTIGGRGNCSRIDGTGNTTADAGARMLAPGTYYLRVASTSTTAAAQFDYRLVVTLRE